ncbi:Variant Ionotropic Glutamate Receptor [Penaeus vannamei]|uniref:Variant Ionotropic Glutamate Receptor n=1 Tax=Penaeus vannamei TaxID=6689 RepID=A0A423SN29_PENVA|nr:Variant Ionotropic Glutamate Receptor [Penaeus vannamei]
MVMQVGHEMLRGCHIVLATAGEPTVFLDNLLSLLHRKEMAMTVINADAAPQPPGQHQDEQNRINLLRGLWGDPRFTCRALVLDLTQGKVNTVLRFLEESALRERPHARVILLGPNALTEGVLFHPSLENTIHTLYFALNDLILQRLRQRTSIKGKEGDGTVNSRVRDSLVDMFSKCLYCMDGTSGIRFLGSRSLLQESELQENITDDYDASRFTIINIPTRVRRRGHQLNSTQHSQSSALSAYVVREPWDRQWGVFAEETGNWTGIVGTLQYEKADLSLGVGPTADRLRVMEHSRVYSPEPFVIVSLKPQPLPQYLALIRPYEGEVWVLVILLTPAAGVVLWLLQKTWSIISEERGMKFSSAFLCSLSILLGDQSPTGPTHVTARVLLGSWMLNCMIITAAYRSSLIAHLTVQKKFPPINTFEDLLGRKGWRWGRMPSSGTSFTFFNKSSDPVVNSVFMNIEYHDLDENMKQVLKGGYSFLTNKYYVSAIISTYYTNSLGYTPIYLSSKDYPIYSGFSWGFRKGAPFRRAVSMIQQRIIEAGLITHWVDDVVKARARKVRMKRKLAGQETRRPG